MNATNFGIYITYDQEMRIDEQSFRPQLFTNGRQLVLISNKSNLLNIITDIFKRIFCYFNGYKAISAEQLNHLRAIATRSLENNTNFPFGVAKQSLADTKEALTSVQKRLEIAQRRVLDPQDYSLTQEHEALQRYRKVLQQIIPALDREVATTFNAGGNSLTYVVTMNLDLREVTLNGATSISVL